MEFTSSFWCNAGLRRLLYTDQQRTLFKAAKRVIIHRPSRGEILPSPNCWLCCQVNVGARGGSFILFEGLMSGPMIWCDSKQLTIRYTCDSFGPRAIIVANS